MECSFCTAQYYYLLNTDKKIKHQVQDMDLTSNRESGRVTQGELEQLI